MAIVKKSLPLAAGLALLRFASAQSSDPVATEAIPQDIVDGFAEDSLEVQVSYNGEAENGFPSGEEFQPDEVADAPTFALGDDSGLNTEQNFVLALVDTTCDERTLHYLQAGFKASGEKTGIESSEEPMIAYQAPGAFQETGNRQYTYLLFLQQNQFNADAEVPAPGEVFDYPQFMDTLGLRDARAAVGMFVNLGGEVNCGGAPPAAPPPEAEEEPEVEEPEIEEPEVVEPPAKEEPEVIEPPPKEEDKPWPPPKEEPYPPKVYEPYPPKHEWPAPEPPKEEWPAKYEHPPAETYVPPPPPVHTPPPVYTPPVYTPPVHTPPVHPPPVHPPPPPYMPSHPVYTYPPVVSHPPPVETYVPPPPVETYVPPPPVETYVPPTSVYVPPPVYSWPANTTVYPVPTAPSASAPNVPGETFVPPEADGSDAPRSAGKSIFAIGAALLGLAAYL